MLLVTGITTKSLAFFRFNKFSDTSLNQPAYSPARKISEGGGTLGSI